MICLGIESTAHTAAIGVFDENGNILAEIKDMYTRKEGGIIPIEAAKHHKEVFPKLFKEIENKIDIKSIDLIAYSQSPGLAPCLIEGMRFASEIADKLNLPLVGVSHVVAHLEIGKFFTKSKDPIFIFTSGANTQIITYESKRYRIIGECLSIALGNALDKFGRAAGLGFPAGPKIEKLALSGRYIELPYVVKGMDVEFSGIVTSAIHKLKTHKLEDICFSLQETLFAMTTEITERAMAHMGKKEALLVGGVAANKRFCEMLSIMCKERGAKFYACPIKYAGDNGIQIAITGILKYNAQGLDKIIDINPSERTDDVEVSW